MPRGTIKTWPTGDTPALFCIYLFRLFSDYDLQCSISVSPGFYSQSVIPWRTSWKEKRNSVCFLIVQSFPVSDFIQACDVIDKVLSGQV